MLSQHVTSQNRCFPAVQGKNTSAFKSMRDCHFSYGWILISDFVAWLYTRQTTCTGATRLQSFSWQHARWVTRGPVKEVSNCNTIRPLGVVADRPAFKPVIVEESGCMDLSQICQPLYTATACPRCSALIAVLPMLVSDVWKNQLNNIGIAASVGSSLP